MLADLLVDVAALIEATIIVEKVSVTLPEPPATDACSAAYVWGSQLYDADFSTQQRGDIAGCFFQRAYLISYRIDHCYKPSEKEKSTADQLSEASTFYDLADAVYCALMNGAADGTLFDAVNVDDCADITIQPLVLGAPQGDRVSAVGTIRVQKPCETGS